MKKQILFCLALLWLLSACGEKPPVLSECYEQNQRTVLVEKHTGANCPNCPKGNDKIETLAELYGVRLVTVSIHAAGNQLAAPVDPADPDLRTVDGALLADLFSVTANPMGVINRTVPSGGSEYQQMVNSWAGQVSAAYCPVQQVDLAITTTYDTASHTVEVQWQTTALEAIDLQEDLAISIMLTEDDIIADQKGPNGTLADYQHQHVLRDVLTDVQGQLIVPMGTPFATMSESWNYPLDADWNAANCHIVAFVHYKGSRWDVLDVVDSPVQ